MTDIKIKDLVGDKDYIKALRILVKARKKFLEILNNDKKK